jgi:hypothetical protein
VIHYQAIQATKGRNGPLNEKAPFLWSGQILLKGIAAFFAAALFNKKFGFSLGLSIIERNAGARSGEEPDCFRTNSPGASSHQCYLPSKRQS